VSPLLAGLLAAVPAVQVGLERVEADGAGLRGRRVGLIAHAASVTASGRHAIDVLRAAGVDVRRLFAPEHGLRSRAAAGEEVASGTDEASGLPVVSLYGERTKPTPEDLAGLDALVADLQDAGARFYTYSATVLLALEAAAEADVELVVLDRPNPLGGVLMEGPVADAAEGVPTSLVNRAPGPVVHGLTLGELARFANTRRARPARLRVVPLSGWSRSMTWIDTGRPWVPPSPNLRTPEAALAYPGTCLVEATNLSEGRGTRAPFLLLGAPWLDPRPVIKAVRAQGFRLATASFTPAASPSAPEPKHEGLLCRGIRVRVADRRAVRPYALGLRLLAALRSHPEFRWVREGAWLDALTATRRVREALDRGEPAEAILERDRPGLAAFAEERRAALLY